MEKSHINKFKCSYCNSEPVFFRKISNEKLCVNHFIQTIEKKIRRSVRKYNMFSPQDKVVVGVSGGKDSFAMLYNIKILQDRYPKGPKVEAILIDEGIKGYREESLKFAQNYCKKLEVPLHIITFKDNFGTTLDTIIPKLSLLKINACTICGTVRRRLLNDSARDLGADYLAIGHNLDDTIQTFLANILRNDTNRIGLIDPSGNLKDPQGKLIPRVKPLMEIPEEEIVRYCYYKKIPIQTHPCPYTENFSILRKDIQDFINKLERNSAEIKYNLLKANTTLFNIIFEKNKSKFVNPNKTLNYNHCKSCETPCSPNRQICYYCELKKSLKINH